MPDTNSIDGARRQPKKQLRLQKFIRPWTHDVSHWRFLADGKPVLTVSTRILVDEGKLWVELFKALHEPPPYRWDSRASGRAWLQAMLDTCDVEVLR
jgi:hypothetical protein